MIRRICIPLIFLCCVLSFSCKSTSPDFTSDIKPTYHPRSPMSSFWEDKDTVGISLLWYDITCDTNMCPSDIKIKYQDELGLVSHEKYHGGLGVESSLGYKVLLNYDSNPIDNEMILIDIEGMVSYTKENFSVEFAWKGELKKNGGKESFCKLFNDPISKETRVLLFVIITD